jgi:hypothetical protein
MPATIHCVISKTWDDSEEEEEEDDEEEEEGDDDGDEEDEEEDDEEDEEEDDEEDEEEDDEEDEEEDDDVAADSDVESVESDSPEEKERKQIAAKLQADADAWRELHDWIIEFRDEHELSVVNFLEFCSLPQDELYFKQLVGKTGGERNPSTDEKTAGSKLRAGIQATKQQVETDKLKPFQRNMLRMMKFMNPDNM